jgi:hypothetical protein
MEVRVSVDHNMEQCSQLISRGLAAVVSGTERNAVTVPRIQPRLRTAATMKFTYHRFQTLSLLPSGSVGMYLYHIGAGQFKPS